MSTILISRNKVEARIVDVCKFGTLYHKYVETGRVYARESTAIKRALIKYRKKYGKTGKLIRRRRKYKTIRKRRVMLMLCPIVPIINTIYDNGEKKFIVWETGKTFKEDEYDKAIAEAIRYYRRNSNGRNNAREIL